MSTFAHPVNMTRGVQLGLTLIELMVAMALGLVVTLGVVAIFQSTASSNRAQMQLALLQEEGRFAVTRMKRDLEMANGLYCSNSGGAAKSAEISRLYLDGLRTPMVYSRSLTNEMRDVTTFFYRSSGGNRYPDEPYAPYSMPSYLFMRGYDCGGTATSCKPTDPGTELRGSEGIPAMGRVVGQRAIGTDVITVRYVDADRGWAVGAGGTSVVANTKGEIHSITIRPRAGEPPASEFSNDVAMLADCSSALVFGVIKRGDTLTPEGRPYNFEVPVSPQQSPSLKLYDFERGFQTVTYYVKLVDNGNGQSTGALMRRVNGGATRDGNANPGGSEDELVRGVERLDFRYGIQDAAGKLRYVTADVVDAGKGIPCPPGEPGRITDVGCLWRAVSSIEINLVVSGQVPLYTLTPGELAYTYGIDGRLTPTPPSGHRIKPGEQGFPEQMLRREFTAVVAVRNFNP